MKKHKIKEHKNNLQTILKKINNFPQANHSSNPSVEARYDFLKKIRMEELVPFACELGACYFVSYDLAILELKDQDIHRSLALVEGNIAQIISNIHLALETESAVINIKTAKWSCFWAAIAAIAACISTLLILFYK